jgi:hypothetical protein
MMKKLLMSLMVFFQPLSLDCAKHVGRHALEPKLECLEAPFVSFIVDLKLFVRHIILLPRIFWDSLGLSLLLATLLAVFCSLAFVIWLPCVDAWTGSLLHSITSQVLLLLSPHSLSTHAKAKGTNEPVTQAASKREEEPEIKEVKMPSVKTQMKRNR